MDVSHVDIWAGFVDYVHMLASEYNILYTTRIYTICLAVAVMASVSSTYSV